MANKVTTRYECEDCGKVHTKKVDVCENCGSTFLQKINTIHVKIEPKDKKPLN